MAPLLKSFGEIHTKESLAKPGEMDYFKKHGNMLAALDFIPSVESDVFMPSHGGNMAHVIQVTICTKPLCLHSPELYFRCTIFGKVQVEVH